MTTGNISSALLSSYPEQNPFLLDPQPYNLTPAPDALARLDTKEFCAAALAIAQSTGINPLNMSYGTNPFIIVDPRLEMMRLPFTGYRRPPPVKKTRISDDIVFLEQICRYTTDTALFTIRMGEDIRLLKVYPKKKIDQIPNLSLLRDRGEASPLCVDRFKQELDSYAHLQHYGICDKGVVPKCYGWVNLSRQHIKQILALPDISDDAQLMRRVKEPPQAVVLEYFPDAAQLTVDNVTEKLADAALRGLCEIHSAYVMHGDIDGRNILVLPDERVVWVDFNHSQTPESARHCTRQHIFEELGRCWSEMYQELLPGKRINVSRLYAD